MRSLCEGHGHRKGGLSSSSASGGIVVERSVCPILLLLFEA